MCQLNNQKLSKKEEYIYYPIFPCGIGRVKKSELTKLKVWCEEHQKVMEIDDE